MECDRGHLLFSEGFGVGAANTLNVHSRKRQLHGVRQSESLLCKSGIGMAHPYLRRAKAESIHVHHSVDPGKFLFAKIANILLRPNHSLFLAVKRNKDEGVLSWILCKRFVK